MQLLVLHLQLDLVDLQFVDEPLRICLCPGRGAFFCTRSQPRFRPAVNRRTLSASFRNRVAMSVLSSRFFMSLLARDSSSTFVTFPKSWNQISG
jgi:hypothetical protein